MILSMSCPFHSQTKVYELSFKVSPSHLLVDVTSKLSARAIRRELNEQLEHTTTQSSI